MSRMFTKLPKRTVLATWLLSYVVILLVPVMLGFMTYTQLSKTVVDGINRSNGLVLAKVKHDMDNMLEEANQLSVEIAFMPAVQNLQRLPEPLTPPQQFDVHQAFESLKAIHSSNRSSSYYVYFPAIDRVITPFTSNSSEVIYNNLYGTYDGYKEWLGRLNQTYQGEYIKIGDNEGQSSLSLSEIAFVRSLPLTKTDSATATIVVGLDHSALWPQKSGEEAYEGTVLIMDADDSVLAASAAVQESLPVAYDKLLGPSGMMRVTFRGEPAVASYIHSSVTDWAYIILMPEYLFWDSSDYVRKVAVAALLACLMIGGALTFAFVRRNYSPLRRLVLLISSRSDKRVSEPDQLNEYDYMHQVIHSTIEENTDMNRKLWRQSRLLRSQCIEKLLTGRSSGIPVELTLEANEIFFESDCFAVLIFQVEDYFHHNDSLVRFALANVAEEVVSAKHQAFAVDMSDLIVCLICFSHAKRELWTEEVTEMVGSVQGFMHKYYHIQIGASVSGYHDTTVGISAAFEEAMEVVEYQGIYGTAAILFYSRVRQSQAAGEYYYPLEKEKALMNCIKAGDFPGAEYILDHIFQENLDNRKLPLRVVKCLNMDLAGTMLKTAQEIRPVPDPEMDILEGLLQGQSIQEMKEQLKNMLLRFCHRTEQDQSEKRKSGAISKIMELVREQYSDVNLNVAALGERMEMHPTSISRLFKEGTGQSLLDYLNQYRIEQAKLFISRHPEATMEETAAAAGFGNVRTFRRLFLKYEGITPGKYAEMK